MLELGAKDLGLDEPRRALLADWAQALVRMANVVNMFVDRKVADHALLHWIDRQVADTTEVPATEWGRISFQTEDICALLATTQHAPPQASRPLPPPRAAPPPVSTAPSISGAVVPSAPLQLAPSGHIARPRPSGQGTQIRRPTTESLAASWARHADWLPNRMSLAICNAYNAPEGKESCQACDACPYHHYCKYCVRSDLPLQQCQQTAHFFAALATSGDPLASSVSLSASAEVSSPPTPSSYPLPIPSFDSPISTSSSFFPPASAAEQVVTRACRNPNCTNKSLKPDDVFCAKCGRPAAQSESSLEPGAV